MQNISGKLWRDKKVINVHLGNVLLTSHFLLTIVFNIIAVCIRIMSSPSALIAHHLYFVKHRLFSDVCHLWKHCNAERAPAMWSDIFTQSFAYFVMPSIRIISCAYDKNKHCYSRTSSPVQTLPGLAAPEECWEHVVALNESPIICDTFSQFIAPSLLWPTHCSIARTNRFS